MEVSKLSYFGKIFENLFHLSHPDNSVQRIKAFQHLRNNGRFVLENSLKFARNPGLQV